MLIKLKKMNYINLLKIKKDKISFKKVAEGNLNHDMLKTSDTYVVDFGDQLCVWIGKSAPKKEKRKCNA